MESLPPVDVILLSHGHMDHCDTATLRRLSGPTRVIMPQETASILDGLSFAEVTELAWGAMSEVGGVHVEAFPVTHKGARFPWSGSSKGSGPGSNSYIISRNDTTIVFAGDTAYQERFREIALRGNTVDLAILPIGGYIPHHENHCTPEEALIMADDMSARHILPIHWGTFPGEEPLTEPIERLRSAVSDPARIVIDTIGQTWVMER
jgi:L-ascorbate metabolism protein UlaG (beta-lactamase superfamily)